MSVLNCLSVNHMAPEDGFFLGLQKVLFFRPYVKLSMSVLFLSVAISVCTHTAFKLHPNMQVVMYNFCRAISVCTCINMTFIFYSTYFQYSNSKQVAKTFSLQSQFYQLVLRNQVQKIIPRRTNAPSRLSECVSLDSLPCTMRCNQMTFKTNVISDLDL